MTIPPALPAPDAHDEPPPSATLDERRSAHLAEGSGGKLARLCQLFGLHPLVAFGMLAVDFMLFGGEGASLGVSWPISVAVAAALTVPSILLQRSVYRDSWGAAAGKGILIGVLTAIPTPLPSIIPLLGGVAGTVRLLGKR